MLRADPFLPALDVNFSRSFQSRRIVSFPRIFTFELVAASRGPVATESNSLRVVPGHIVDCFFFFLLEVM
jgi:hypothetical protein